MKGDAHYIDRQPILNRELAQLILEFGFIHENSGGNSHIYANENISLKFSVVDQNNIGFSFSHPRELSTEFTLRNFCRAVLNTQPPEMLRAPERDIDLLNALTSHIKYYADNITQCLRRPFSGEYNWKKSYAQYLEETKGFLDYAYQTTEDDCAERQEITKTIIQGNNGWESSARDYFKKVGK